LGPADVAGGARSEQIPMPAAMSQSLQVLIVDNSADDIALVVSALRSQGYQVAYSAVNNPAVMRTELERQEWDVIISDHSVPNFDAAEALALAKAVRPDVPFIVVSENIDLNLVVALMKSGMQDYVQTSELVRLGSVIERELREAKSSRERQRAEDRVQESQAIFQAIVENVCDLVALVDTEGRRIYNSPSYQPLFHEEDIQVGSTSFMEIHPDDRERIKAAFRRTVATGVGERGEFRFVLKDGSVRHIESDGCAICDARGKVTKVLVVSRDITERKRMETELLQMATTDYLTGLPNRRYFLARLEEEHSRMQRLQGQRAAILMLDLDHFKRVNDRFGHALGDACLKHVAALIRCELRKIDTAGRLGGEEFGIILSGADVTSAQVFAERLRLKVADTACVLKDQVIRMTVSIGLVAVDGNEADIYDALARADRALYGAKDNGRNRLVVAAESGLEI